MSPSTLRTVSRGPTPVFWETAKELFENQKIPVEIPGALFPYFLVCGRSVNAADEFEEHAKKQPRGSSPY